MAFSLIINFKGTIDFLGLFFINAGLGIITEGSSNSASWYACNLFWISVIYGLLFKDSPEDGKKRGWLMVSVIILLSLLVRRKTGLYSDLVVDSVPFLTNGIAIAVVGFSIGILFFFGTPHMQMQMKWLVTCCQLLSSGYLVYIFAFSKNRFNFIYALLITLIALYFLYFQTGLSCFNNSKLFSTLGSYSYSIYMMQFPCFHYVKKAFDADLLPWATPKKLLLFTLLICVFVGIATYYLVELPTAKFLSKRLIYRKADSTE